MGAESFQHGFGVGVNVLSALESLRSPGGLGRYLQGETLARENPNVRASLVGSPFSAGLLGVSGQRGPLSLGPGGTGPSAPNMVWQPNLPPLSPEEQAKQQLAQLDVQDVQALSGLPQEQQQQAMFHRLGVSPTMTPTEMAQYQALAGPQTRITVPGPGGTRFAFGGSPGGAFVERNPEAAKKWEEFKAGLGAQKAEAGMLAKPADAATQTVMTQANDIVNQIDDVNRMLDDPEVERTVEGIAKGRIAFGEYKLGEIFGAKGPAPTLFTTARELLRVESVGRLARAAGTRSRAVWEDLQVHPPQPGDSKSQMRAKLTKLREVIIDGAKNAAKTAQTPRGRLGELVPGPPPASLTESGAGGAAPQVQTTPGGNTYRILPGP